MKTFRELSTAMSKVPVKEVKELTVDKPRIQESTKPVTKFLRDIGFKIKSEEPTKKGMELEFFKSQDAESAKEELESAGYNRRFSINVAGKFLEYTRIS